MNRNMSFWGGEVKHKLLEGYSHKEAWYKLNTEMFQL